MDVLKAYKKDYINLKTKGDYPTYEELVSKVYRGAVETGKPEKGNETQGSKVIIDIVMKEDPRPIYILVWGSMTDIAQALYDKPNIADKIRVYSIGSWNTVQDQASRDYIYKHRVDLWWIENDETFRGMYMGGNQEKDLGNMEFVKHHIKDHGALGDLFVEKKADLKMGDTPSVLYMLSPLVGGIGKWEDPEEESWGGSFEKLSGRPFYWKDKRDARLIVNGKRGGVTVNKWREAYLRDWQKRMDRCVAEDRS